MLDRRRRNGRHGQDNALSRAGRAVRSADRPRERRRGQPVARELLRRRRRDAHVRDASPASFSRDALRQSCAACAGWAAVGSSTARGTRTRRSSRAACSSRDYMTSDEWTLYRRLYAELLHSPAARPPRLLIYLHGSARRHHRAHRHARTAEARRKWRRSTGVRCTSDTSVGSRSFAIVPCCPSTCANTISSPTPSAIDEIVGARAAAVRGRAAADGAVARGVAPRRVRVNVRAPDGTSVEDSPLSRRRSRRGHSLVAR